VARHFILIICSNSAGPPQIIELEVGDRYMTSALGKMSIFTTSILKRYFSTVQRRKTQLAWLGFSTKHSGIPEGDGHQLHFCHYIQQQMPL
jgi:hypothetical protein